jgi:protein-S-isoprenylcysteine O-methyltransferase Ste14
MGLDNPRALATLSAVTPAHLPVLTLVALSVCWAAFGLTWVVGAFYNSSRGPDTRTRTPFGSALLITAAAVFILRHAVPPGDWTSLRLHAAWVHVIGLVVLLASTAFTLWARLALGTMWSAAPMVKQEHQLRTDGPYAVTRHPIYTGILGMVLGTALLAGAGAWALPFPILLVVLEIKLHIEERLMLTEFPDDYPAYRRRVPQLMPGLRLLLRRPGAAAA